MTDQIPECRYCMHWIHVVDVNGLCFFHGEVKDRDATCAAWRPEHDDQPDYLLETDPEEFIHDLAAILSDGDNMAPDKLVADLRDLVRCYLRARYLHSTMKSAVTLGKEPSLIKRAYSRAKAVLGR